MSTKNPKNKLEKRYMQEIKTGKNFDLNEQTGSSVTALNP